jgi:arylsulfatase A-like enzyme
MYDPDDVELPLAPVGEELRHPIHEVALAVQASAAPKDESKMRQLRAQYFGMISEVDFQLGRVVHAIEERGEWADTLVIVTSDHGEQLGDHGLIEKLGFFPQSYHVLGLWRNPNDLVAGESIKSFTENVDLLPTLCETLGVVTPSQCDGRSLYPLMRQETCDWRTAAHYEWDYRSFSIKNHTGRWPDDRTLSRQNLAVSVSDDIAYVQFGDGVFRCFDLLLDPTWRSECTDDSRILHAAQEQLVWRQEHLDRELTDMLLSPSRAGRWPAAFVER